MPAVDVLRAGLAALAVLGAFAVGVERVGATSAGQARGAVFRCEHPRLGEGGRLVCGGGTEPSSDVGLPPGVYATLRTRVDPNRASLAELDSLPGVGKVLAARIVEGRPYRRAEDLLRVRGIGARRLAAMAPRLVVGDADP
ncbi:MAG: helix-hairpin-helix domain-containing protein [Deltaproteobacteria bacterium]|nr:MAG: helix-hairpin-helix domain-containing protein [Deltaproteobacteria bacterium]